MEATGAIELRSFGLIFGALFVLFFGLVIPWIGGDAFPLWPWYVGAMAWVWAAAHPPSLAPVFRIWLRAGALLGWINTRVVLTIVFYMVIAPIALMMKIFGRDPLSRKLDPKLDTYRVKRKKPAIENMEKPF